MLNQPELSFRWLRKTHDLLGFPLNSTTLSAHTESDIYISEKTLVRIFSYQVKVISIITSIAKLTVKESNPDERHSSWWTGVKARHKHGAVSTVSIQWLGRRNEIFWHALHREVVPQNCTMDHFDHRFQVRLEIAGLRGMGIFCCAGRYHAWLIGLVAFCEIFAIKSETKMFKKNFPRKNSVTRKYRFIRQTAV